MKNKIFKFLFVAIVIITVLPGSLLANIKESKVQVLLKNGDKITGNLKQLNSRVIVINTEYSGKIKIPINMIKLLPVDKKMKIFLKNDERVALHICQISDGKFYVESKNVQYIVEPESIVRIEKIREEAKISKNLSKPCEGISTWHVQRWQGNLDFGYNLNRGTTSSDDMFLRTQSYYINMRSKLTFRGHIFYGLKDGEISKKEIYGSTRYDYSLKNKFFAFGQFSAEYDAVEKINLRHSYNTGMGYTFVNTPELNFNMDTGLGWQQEIYMYDSHKNNGSALLEQHLFWRMNSRLLVDQKLSLIPYITGPARYRFVLDMNIKSPVAKHLLLTFGIVNRYDSRPQQGVEKNDFMALTGFGYVF